MDVSKEKMAYYRDILKTLINEFIDLPHNEQENFLMVYKEYSGKLNRIIQEHSTIKEKILHIEVSEVRINQEGHIVIGKVVETGDEGKIFFPAFMKTPSLRDTISCSMFSVDGNIWYSSKKILIKECSNETKMVSD